MNIQKNRKLRGSVLLTVVVVMSLLIVFLVGTLALASATNNRAHVNYSSAQTGVTSRMVAESAIDAMELDKTYKRVIGGIKENSADVKVPVRVNGGTVDGSGNPTLNSNALGHIDDVVISYAGKKKFYNDLTQKWEDRDMLKFTSSVTLGGVTSKTSAYILKHLATDPDPGNGKGAGFVTAAGATLNCQTSIYGGAYINLPSKEEIEAKKYNYDIPSSYRDFYPYGLSNKATKDTTMRLDNSGGYAEADVYINNNVWIENWSGFVFPEEGKGITIWGDLGFGNDHTRISTNVNQTDLQFNKIPYLYVDGNIYARNKFKIGNAGGTDPLNIYCGTFNKEGKTLNDCDVYADIYCMDEKGTSCIGFGTSTVLSSWAGSVVNRAESESAKGHTHGIYSNGNVEIKTVDVEGDVRVAKNCIIRDSNVTIHGDLVVGGTLYIENAGKLTVDGTIYCDNISGINSGSTSSDYKKMDCILHSDSQYVEFFEYDLETCPNFISYDGGNTYQQAGYLTLDGSQTWNAGTLYYTYAEGISPLSVEFPEAPSTKPGDVNDMEEKMAVTDEWIAYYAELRDYLDEGYQQYELAGSGYDIVEDGGKYTYLLKNAPDYYTIPNFDGSDSDEVTFEEYVWYRISDETIVDEIEATNVSSTTTTTGSSLADWRQKMNNQGRVDTVYPNYATRRVLLGLDTVKEVNSKTDVPKAETQVVKTMEEILKDVANPYDFRELPNNLKAIYNSLKSEPTINVSNSAAVKAEMGNVGLDSYYSGGKWQIMASATGNQGVYINKSCKITGDISNGIPGKVLVIDPGKEDILVVVQNVTIGNSVKVLVNDAEGGSVSIYIEQNGKFIHGGGGVIATTSWLNMLDKYNGKELQYATDSRYLKAGVPDIATELGENAKPKLNIYGGYKSQFGYVDNASLVTANILSPYIEGEFKASAKDYDFTAFYYNGVNIKQPIAGHNESNPAKNWVFGCVNAEKMTLPNEFNVIYVTDGGGTKPKPDPDDGNFWYKVLYYDES